MNKTNERYLGEAFFAFDTFFPSQLGTTVVVGAEVVVVVGADVDVVVVVGAEVVVVVGADVVVGVVVGAEVVVVVGATLVGPLEDVGRGVGEGEFEVGKIPNHHNAPNVTAAKITIQMQETIKVNLKFLQHIVLLSWVEFFLKEVAVASRSLVLLNKTSIFSPLSIILFKFCPITSFASFKSLLTREMLSTFLSSWKCVGDIVYVSFLFLCITMPKL